MNTFPPAPVATLFPAALHGLLSPEAQPGVVARVELVETPLSWVLLAGDRAYKIKRPVHYPFVDFRRLSDRQACCEAELRLNRRFAPTIYLGVVPITQGEGGARFGGTGPPIEYAVEMRRFDRREELDVLVREGRVGAEELAAFGDWLARVHATLPGLSTDRAAGWPADLAAAVLRNADECREACSQIDAAAQLPAVERRLGAALESSRALLHERAGAGCVRECHGDLHLSNVVRVGGQLLPFDCLEFAPAFRWIDRMQDCAFLYADLLGYGQPLLAVAFLNGYLAQSGDYGGCRLLPLYAADRALVRAKVLALQVRHERGLAAADLGLRRARAQGYVELALRILTAPVPRAAMMTGLPGSGKSWLAARLAAQLPAIVVRADLERKRIAGLGALQASGSPIGAGLYDAALTDRVYARLADCAAGVLAGGQAVIVDANFGARRQRAALAEVCASKGAPLYVVECRAPDAVLRQRIAARQAAAADPSEADGRVLDLQRERREPIVGAEGLSVVAVDTCQDDVVPEILRFLRAPDASGAA